MSAGRQIRQASKQTNKNEQCGSIPPKGMPQANWHSMWALASHGGYLWQFVHCGRRYATYLQREIQTVPVRSEDGDSRLGGRGLSQARPGVTARAAIRPDREDPENQGFSRWLVAMVRMRHSVHLGLIRTSFVGGMRIVPQWTAGAHMRAFREIRGESGAVHPCAVASFPGPCWAA